MCPQKTIQKFLKANNHHQQGFTLVMVMMIMVIIALLVVGGSHVTNTEMRIAANDADYKYAVGIAERALLIAEQEIHDNVIDNDDPAEGPHAIAEDCSTVPVGTKCDKDMVTMFPDNACDPKTGFCGFNQGTPLWERESTWEKIGGKEPPSVSVNVGEAPQPRYIAEYLGIRKVEGEENRRIFRVTARAWGKNGDTKATFQSVITTPAP